MLTNNFNYDKSGAIAVMQHNDLAKVQPRQRVQIRSHCEIKMRRCFVKRTMGACEVVSVPFSS
jgi:hypothetical protein